MDLQLTDKIVVVTGAASGIGEATARLLTEEGALVGGLAHGPIDSGLGARGPAMRASGGGRLVPLGSASARLPEIGNLGYAAAKLPLLALSSSLAAEFSPQGIRSNVVVPGPARPPLYDRPGGFGDQAAELWGTDKETAITRMATEIRPLLTGRMGQPDDIAQVVAYLVSPLSGQVTAAEWSVDGGAQRHI